MSRYSLFAVVVLVCAVGVACLPSDPPPPTQAEIVERGRYLVTIGGCNDCHTPKVFSGGGPSPDDSRLLSGHPQDLELPPYSFDEVGPGQWLRFNEHLPIPPEWMTNRIYPSSFMQKI